ncbi:MAG: hypothetical protein AB1716_01015 [Planctomycetota bacterium]
MAAVINADGATIIGTLEQIAAFLRLLQGQAGVINLDRANFVIVREALTAAQLKAAIEATPRRGK